MSFAIMRIQKIKSKQALTEREKHNTRLKEVINADGSKNITIEGHKGLTKRLEALERQVDKNAKRKTRKDAVRAMEIVFTSDKAFFNRVDYNQYFDLCKEWLEETFETQELFQYSIHNDEEVQHLHCIISTLKDGKFNYSGYINGRKDLRALQDSFFEKVKHLGLDRGQKVELTNSKYTSNKEWNKNIEKARSFADALSEENKMDYAIKGVMAEETERKLQRKIDYLEKDNFELNQELNALKRVNKKALPNIKRDKDKDIFIKNLIQAERKKMEEELEALEPPTMEEMGVEM